MAKKCANLKIGKLSITLTTLNFQELFVNLFDEGIHHKKTAPKKRVRMCLANIQISSQRIVIHNLHFLHSAQWSSSQQCFKPLICCFCSLCTSPWYIILHKVDCKCFVQNLSGLYLLIRCRVFNFCLTVNFQTRVSAGQNLSILYLNQTSTL